MGLPMLLVLKAGAISEGEICLMLLWPDMVIVKLAQ